MKKESVKIYKNVFVMLILISLFLFTIQFVVAQESKIFDPIKDLFTFNLGEDISTPLAQWLFLILLTLFIWSIINSTMSDLIKYPSVQWLISFIIAFLGVAYLTPNEVWGTLSTYNALAITLLFILPIVILIFFTFKSTVGDSAIGSMLQLPIWIIYFLVLASIFVTDLIKKRLAIGDPASWIFIASGAIAMFFILFNKKIRNLMLKQHFESMDINLKKSLATSLTGKRYLEGIGVDVGKYSK